MFLMTHSQTSLIMAEKIKSADQFRFVTFHDNNLTSDLITKVFYVFLPLYLMLVLHVDNQFSDSFNNCSGLLSSALL